MDQINRKARVRSSQQLVCLKCNHVTSMLCSPEKICPNCGFSLVPPPAYLGWEPLDVMMFKFSNTLLDVQKLTSIWTWIATEKTHPEDVESVMPKEESTSKKHQIEKECHTNILAAKVRWDINHHDLRFHFGLPRFSVGWKR